MIVGVGVDLVEMARIAALLGRWGEASGRHILSADEQREFLKSADQVRFLAKRFAVKEAFAKALGTGFRAPVLCTAIGMRHDSLGKPELVLATELAELLQHRGITQQHVSVSDERQHALAFVVLESR